MDGFDDFDGPSNDDDTNQADFEVADGIEDEQEAQSESVIAAAKRRISETVETLVLLIKVAPISPIFLLSPILSALPKTWKIYHKLNRWSAWQMQKSASADALANVRLPSGHEDIRPAAWKEGAEDEKDLTGWKILGLGDKRFDPAVHGRSTARMGKASLIHINADDLEQGTWAECAMDNAIQLDREQYLFRDATVENVISVPNNNGRARADGGQMQATSEISVKSPGIHHDTLVPISSREGYDGQIISWDQYSNLKSEQSDQETVRSAKNSAWAAAKLDDIEGRDLLKWVLIIGIWSAILLFHQDIGAFISGLAGGGDGGAVGSGLGMITVGV